MQQYESFRENGWRSWDRDETDIGYPKVISYFVKRNPSDVEISGKVMQIREETFDKEYQVNSVVRMMQDKMMTKKETIIRNGIKKRITPTKKFLNMKPWEEYMWISMIEEIRYCILNNIDVIYLSYKEVQLISNK